MSYNESARQGLLCVLPLLRKPLYHELLRSWKTFIMSKVQVLTIVHGESKGFLELNMFLVSFSAEELTSRLCQQDMRVFTLSPLSY
jgi:hypothetical protein